ncbi:MAG: hypothetical protein HOP29_14490 [Phycisphaerales bacterium]|nr:hypothetical protein [Phycisphaerales bacterium]
MVELFRGRDDIIAVATGRGFDWERGSITPERLEAEHLSGKRCLGVYSPRLDNTCFFSAVDFDNKTHAPDPRWREKAEALYFELVKSGFTPLVEISQSGCAAHVWLFFIEPIEAWIVRAFWRGVETRIGIKFKEVYPKQDTLTGKCIGNLIRYPLWGQSRFVDLEDDWNTIDPMIAMKSVTRVSEADLRMTAMQLGFGELQKPAEISAAVSSDGLSPRVQSLIGKPNTLLAKRWKGDATGMRDTSRSAVAMSIATELVRHSVPTAEVETAIRQWCADNGCDKGERDDWVRTTVQKAYAFAESPAKPRSGAKCDRLPVVTLPDGVRTYTEVGRDLGALLGRTERVFNRGGAVARYQHGETLEVLEPKHLQSEFETVAQLARWDTRGDEPKLKPALCSESVAKAIMHAEAFVSQLPELKLLSSCPVTIERDGRLVQVCGYDRASGIYAAGAPVPDVTVEEARQLFDELLKDFQFASPSDRSRALASVIAPALVFGELSRCRLPMDMTEADHSQAGKGFRNKLTAAIYGRKVATITTRKSGVGSVDEQFSAKLIAGEPFISFDNMRDKINSTEIESFLTEDVFTARTAYSKNVAIDPRRFVIMFTSNRAETTRDLSNRSAIVRLRKQPEDYRFARYVEGDILAHVRANPSKYLAAVFAVVRMWFEAGRPGTNETRHDFRAWAQTLDWIAQHVLGEAPLLVGHQGEQRRVSTPSMTWLRDVVMAVARAGAIDQWLHTHRLIDLLDDAGIEIPGVGAEGGNLQLDVTRDKAMRGVGRRLASCFGSSHVIIIDAHEIERRTYHDEQQRERHEYQVRLIPDVRPPKSPQDAGCKTPHSNGSFPKFPEVPEEVSKFAKATLEKGVVDGVNDIRVYETSSGTSGIREKRGSSSGTTSGTGLNGPTGELSVDDLNQQAEWASEADRDPWDQV